MADEDEGNWGRGLEQNGNFDEEDEVGEGDVGAEDAIVELCYETESFSSKAK